MTRRGVSPSSKVASESVVDELLVGAAAADPAAEGCPASSSCPASSKLHGNDEVPFDGVSNSQQASMGLELA